MKEIAERELPESSLALPLLHEVNAQHNIKGHLRSAWTTASFVIIRFDLFFYASPRYSFVHHFQKYLLASTLITFGLEASVAKGTLLHKIVAAV